MNDDGTQDARRIERQVQNANWYFSRDLLEWIRRTPPLVYAS